MSDPVRHRVPTDVWRDPEFTSMTTAGQLLWFALRTSEAGRSKYRRSRYMSLLNLDRSEIKRAEREIRQRPKYAGAFIARKFRPAIPKRIREAVYARDGYQCVECHATEALSLDHILPYSLGGPDTIENLRVLCIPCNSRKGARI